MPSRPCRWPTCTAYVGGADRYCPAHAAAGRRERAARDRLYDRDRRDPEARQFYNSAAWLRCRAAKLAADPVCERCGRQFARHVHHRKPVKVASHEERLDPANLMSVCVPCHNAIEAEAAA